MIRPKCPGSRPCTAPLATLHEALAWRWVVDRGGGRIDRQPADRQPDASIRARARLDPSGRELAVDGRVVARAGEASLESVPIWIDGPDVTATSYRFRDEAGTEIASRPLDETARANLGFPREGSAVELLIRVAAIDRKNDRVPGTTRLEVARPGAALVRSSNFPAEGVRPDRDTRWNSGRG